MAILALKQWFSLKFMQCASIISSESFWKIYLHRWINLEFLWSSLKVVRTSTRGVSEAFSFPKWNTSNEPKIAPEIWATKQRKHCACWLFFWSICKKSRQWRKIRQFVRFGYSRKHSSLQIFFLKYEFSEKITKDKSVHWN